MKWKIFGSYATKTQDVKSDLDVLICGVNREDLESGALEQELDQLLPLSVERGKHVDLFIDVPEKKRFESVFSSTPRTIAPGSEYYSAIHRNAKDVSFEELSMVASRLATQVRMPILSEEEFIERQNKKRITLESMVNKVGSLSGRSSSKDNLDSQELEKLR
jgi:predicted nucleotidyltransferase